MYSFHNFKEGDVVRIIGPNEANGRGWASAMDDYIGHIAMVRVRDRNSWDLSIRLENCSLDSDIPSGIEWYWWSTPWLELVEESELHFEIDISALNSLL